MIFNVKQLHSNMTRPINTTLQINSGTVINGWVQLLQGNVYQFVGDGNHTASNLLYLVPENLFVPRNVVFELLYK